MAFCEYEEAEVFLKGEDELGNGHRLDPNVTYVLSLLASLPLAQLHSVSSGGPGLQTIINYYLLTGRLNGHASLDWSY